MYRILFLSILLLTLGFTSCEEQQEATDYLCVIKSPVIHSKDSIESFEPLFYGQNNFILYDSNTILYHNKSVFYDCGTGIDFSKPARLFLIPDSLVEIKYAELEHFLKTKFKWKVRYGGSKIMSIASSTDTIRNKAYTVLMNFQKRHPNLICSVRKWTEEEQYTSLAKMNKHPYEPHKIKWKTGFSNGSESLTLEDILPFIPPKVQDEPTPGKKKKLTRYFYPNMSSCGGALYGYYDDTTLVKIDSKFGGELSLTYQTVYYSNGKITRLIYGQELPELDKYHQKYPNSSEVERSKLTYTHDRIEIDFHPVKKIRTFSNKKQIKNSITEEKIEQLLDCAKQMERELASEKLIKP